VTFQAAAFTGPGADDSKRAAKVKALRTTILKALPGGDEESETAAEAYKELFKYVGRKGLRKLTHDKDTSIALQAAWEVHKKTVKRNPPIRNKTDWTFDKKQAQEFLAFFARRVKTKPPAWWRDTLVKGEVFPGSHHAFFDLAEGLPARPKVQEKKDEVVITVGKRSVRISQAAYAEAESFLATDTTPVALWGAKRSFFARPAIKGYPFKAAGVDSKTGKESWVASVWASRRGSSTGPPGRCPVEICREGDTVIVYGCGGIGMYAEGFDARTGKCRFRFCTCYWFNFSEEWGLE
jgi:hypothetical protein